MDWIQKAQQFFNYGNTANAQTVPISAFHMQGKALTWYNWLMDSGHTGGWEEFVVALKVQFSPSAYDDPIGAFTKLLQTSTIEVYQSEFEMLSNRISGLTEEFRVHTFLSGLKEEIRITVTMLKPNCLSAAFGLTRLQEDEVLRRNRKVNSWSSNSNYQITKSSYSRLPAPTFYSKSAPTSNLATPSTNKPQNTYNCNPNIPVRRISLDQMQERREEGLCYCCDERYQPGHRCNRPKIFLLEGMGVDEEPREEENAEEVLPVEELDDDVVNGELLGISLHALVGSPTPCTMRLMGKIGAQMVVVLIDTGSTHSFIDPNIAKKASMPIHSGEKLTIMVADRATFPCQGCCTSVSFCLQGHFFSTTLHLLTLGGCDAVLGIDWLRTLGPILWDFVALTMKFTVHKKEIQLQGLLPAKTLLDDGMTLPKLEGADCKGVWLHMLGEKTTKSKAALHPAVK
jgi:hypothetical protein